VSVSATAVVGDWLNNAASYLLEGRLAFVEHVLQKPCNKKLRTTNEAKNASKCLVITTPVTAEAPPASCS
jgi:hypothetical protein